MTAEPLAASESRPAILTVDDDPGVSRAVARDLRRRYGKTYRIVRGNNQPDDILRYDWKARFTVNLTLNDQADDDDNLTFPIDVTSATVKVQQASGGIVNPPTGGDVEHFEYVLSQASSSRFGGINTSNSMALDVWYDLPSLQKEALVTVTVSFKDADGVVFSKAIDVKVAP